MNNLEFSVIIGRNIKQCREAESMTKEELADKMGVHYMEVEYLETGENYITSKQLHQIAHFLHVPQGTFLQGLPNMPDSVEEIERRINRLRQMTVKFRAGETNDNSLWQILSLATNRKV